jgi:hypothetical protein
VLARDWLEFRDPVQFTAKGMFLRGIFFKNDFDGAVSAQGISGQPHLAAAAAANVPDELMIRNGRRRGSIVGRFAARRRINGFSHEKSRFAEIVAIRFKWNSTFSPGRALLF